LGIATPVASPRRWRAACALALDSVPVIVREISDPEKMRAGVDHKRGWGLDATQRPGSGHGRKRGEGRIKARA